MRKRGEPRGRGQSDRRQCRRRSSIAWSFLNNNAYGNLLTLIARGSGFESHTVTSFYEEVIQASQGSRWVWALTLASSIEGLIRILSPRGSLRTDADQAAIDAMRA